MNIITHALAGWCVGRQVSAKPADAAILFTASVLPDIDAIGALTDLYQGGEAIWFSALHHKFGHNIFLCLILMAVVMGFRRDTGLMLWSGLIFHFHLLCDVIGAKGPDGYQWPIYYFYPVSDYEVVWSGQWQINAWPNLVFTVVLLAWFLWQSAKTRFSPLGFFSARFDQAFVDTLRRRLGFKEGEQS